MKRLFFCLSIVVLVSCQKDNGGGDYVPVPQNPERLYAGGKTTTFLATSDAFATPAENLTAEEFDTHMDGDLQFEQTFVTAPAPVNGGLGSIFNNSSCVSCHPRDGRAGFPKDLNARGGLLLRASISGVSSKGAPVPVPGFGTQIQNHAIYGYKPEATYAVRFEESTETFADGTTVNLRKPIFSLENTYIDLPSGSMLSARLASPVFGLGLLEAIPESDLLASQDINDSDGDGISGKANMVWDPNLEKEVVGRFGWKANVGTVLVQSAGAYHDDMGITSYVFPDEHCEGQENCQDNSTGSPEVSDDILNTVAFYCRTLAVPAPRNIDDATVIRGEQLFDQIDCAKCHTPKQRTGPTDVDALSNQNFYPYTDLLLHDMGEGLADGRPDFLANGNEWRTRPLWGIGLTNLINGHTEFLHDGRARNITEAILWHGGEAQVSKEKFKTLPKGDRDALLTFLNSL